ncbi:MAG: orotidine-5'-phosphate decarboxylase [Candidatus Brockarchaeota archaeon]|nr:orotidine-5'-phosphate decarboxylase [Candidatus Brockarchaeota archaeon]
MLESLFKRRILDNAFYRKSRIVLAFDEYGDSDAVLNRLHQFCEQLGEHLAGIKIGYPTILSTGLPQLKKPLSKFSGENVFIADVKMADISFTNSLIARLLYETGFDAVIAHGFIGYEGGLEGVFKEAEKLKRGVVIVVSMSHVGSVEFIDPCVEKLVQTALKHGADGAVAPATRIRVVKRVREIAGSRLLIFTPGVGAQGAPYGAGLLAGADFEIIGRSITGSQNPLDTVLEVKREHDRVLAGGAC